MRHAIAATLFLVLALASFGEEPKPAAKNYLMIPRPEGIDDATWERIQSAHAERVKEFIRILAKAEKDRIQPDRDTIRDCKRKRVVVSSLLSATAARAEEELANADRLLLGNYVFLWSEVSPRLSGAVRRVGRTGASLEEVLASVRPGTAIFLGEGTYRFNLPNDAADRFKDIALIGRGPDKTTLQFNDRQGNITSATRVRIEGVKVRCDDDEWIDVRGDDCSIHLKNCHVFNYNSGAGGSYAISASGGLLLIEGCTFEGDSGRCAGSSHKGNFLRHCDLLYARKTAFVDNGEVVRASFPCTFDECRFQSKSRWAVMDYGGPIWLRRTTGDIRETRGLNKFAFAADDREFVEFILGERKEIEERSRRMAERCALIRHLPYWIRLLGHSDPTVRAKAVQHFEAITGQKVERPAAPPKVPAQRIAGLIKDLDDNRFATRDSARKQLEAIGEGAREQLQAAAQVGSLERRTRAAAILALLDMEAQKALLVRDLEFAQWMKWYETNQTRLRWDEKARRYTIEGR